MPEGFESLPHLTELAPSPALAARLRLRWRTPVRYPALAAAAVLLLALVAGVAVAATHGAGSTTGLATNQPVPVTTARVVGKTQLLKASATAKLAAPGQPAVITFSSATLAGAYSPTEPLTAQSAPASGSQVVLEVHLRPGQSVTAAYLVLSNGSELAGTLQMLNSTEVMATFPATAGKWQAVLVINGQAWLLKIPS